MKKLLLVFFIGFLTAQATDYSASKIVDLMQQKCYPLWTEGKTQEYQQCMDNEVFLETARKVVGFNFVYSGRKLIYGY